MKLCRFAPHRIGVVRGDRVFDITALAQSVMAQVSTEVPANASGDASGDALVLALPALTAALALAPHDESSALPLARVALHSPVRSPTKIVAAPVNYRAHIAEMIGTPAAAGHKQTDIEKAGLFLKANSSLAGPSSPLAIRFPERRTDHEVELVVVIGRKGNRIARAEALSHVAGYCLGLDITLRGPEDRSFRKSIDGYSIVGPWLVTADEIADPNKLMLSLSVNGEPRQRASTRDLVFDVQRLIEFASSFYTLNPGDLLFTGTPEGVGAIRAGDVIDAQGEGLGAMQVKVVSA